MACAAPVPQSLLSSCESDVAAKDAEGQFIVGCSVDGTRARGASGHLRLLNLCELSGSSSEEHYITGSVL